MRARRVIVIGVAVLSASFALAACGPLRGVTQVAAGGEFACALDIKGDVRCWGAGADDQRNLDSVNPTHNPLEVPGAANGDAVQVVTGLRHACARFADGTLACWGRGSSDQLGHANVTTLDPRADIMVPGLTGLVDVAAGDQHTCAVKSDGTVWCWGGDGFGQLGDGTAGGTRSNPMPVIGITDAVAVTAGTKHTCALSNTGTASCWGLDDRGQLGNGPGGTTATPGPVVGLSGVVDLDAGGYGTCAVLTDGTGRCWGENGGGRVGDGTTTNRQLPTVVSGLTGAESIDAGNAHTCAVLTDGTGRCWGRNTVGQLGDGTTTDRHTPVPVSTLTDATSVSAGSTLTCAVLEDNTARCWGDNAQYQLTDRTLASSPTPVVVDSPHTAGPFVEVQSGFINSCGLTTAHTIQCWGDNADVAVTVPGITDAVALANGVATGCAVRTGGTVSCWSAVTDPAGITDVVAVTQGGSHTCYLFDTGRVACHGYNDHGQLGIGTVTAGFVTDPVEVPGLTDVVGISAGDTFTCAVREGGQVLCWGWNLRGQIGLPRSGDLPTPQVVTAVPDGTEIAAGSNYACAVRSGGGVWCWGDNSNGQLGNGAYVPYNEEGIWSTPGPVVGLNDAVAIDAAYRACAIRANGVGLCWGRVQKAVTTPQPVRGLTDVTSASPGLNHVCALRDQLAFCWDPSTLDNATGTAGDFAFAPLQPVVTSG